MKNIKVILIVFFLILSFNVCEVKANTIYSIDMDIYINQTGTAYVTETWYAYLSSGTEGYRAFSDLGESDVSNFTVTDGTGNVYSALSYWSTSSSFDDKAYKSGYNYTSDGLELCWGISSYGTNTYILNYTISNMVTNYSDSQGIYFNFLNIDQNVSEVTISITSDYEFSSENTQIWGFGYDGTVLFENGTIEFKTTDSLSSSDYVVGLIKFEENLFTSFVSSSMSFDEVYEDASYTESLFLKSIKLLFLLLSNFLPIIVFLYIFIHIAKRKKNVIDFSNNGKKLPKFKDINFFRDIPFSGNMPALYWIAYNYNIVNLNDLKNNILGVYFLKLIKNKNIIIEESEKSFGIFNKSKYKIYVLSEVCDDSIENTLLTLLKSCLSSDGFLISKEVSSTYHIFESWFTSVYSKGENFLIDNNYIIKEEIEKGIIFKRTKIVKKATDNLYKEALNLKGLGKFLTDVSCISERSYIEVHIWEEYLMVAHLLGIADEVEKEFNKIYPSYNVNNYDSNDNINCGSRILARNLGKHIYGSYASGKASANSGSGGSSSSSGGGSSGGSSGGGFR